MGISINSVNAILKKLDKYFGYLGGKSDITTTAINDVEIAIIDSAARSASSSSASVIAEYTSPVDFTATYSASDIVIITSVPITIEDASQISYIKWIEEGTVNGGTLVNGSGGVAFQHTAGSVRMYGLTDVIPATAVYEMGLNGQKKAYDETLGADIDYTINSPQYHYISPEEVVNTDASDTKVIRDIYQCDTYSRFSWQGIGVNAADNVTTVTFWVSNDSDADNTADTGWIPYSTDIAGVTSDVFAAAATTKFGHDFTTYFERFMTKKLYATATTTDNVLTEHFRAIF